MAIGDAIYSRTAAHAAVTALVAEVYRSIAPETASLPYIIQTLISTTRHPSMGGYSGALATARFQLDCFATTDSGVASLAEAVRNCWAGYGSGGVAVGTETIYAVFLESDRAMPNTPEFGGEDGTHRRILDLIVWYGEAVPTL
mgnify:CR=1 FL=1